MPDAAPGDVGGAVPGYRHWVLASGNAGKVAEFNARLAAVNIRLSPQTQLGVEAVPETGTTFVENAIIKARHAAAASGRPALADDSGLCVDALAGAPGIHSARFAGANATDARNNQKLLQSLLDQTNRAASFVCVLVLMRSAEDPLPLIVQASWGGEILTEPRGAGGFGYDPLFFVPERGCSSAQLSAKTKNRISHRGQAIDQLLAHLG